MGTLAAIRSLDRRAKTSFIAAFLGWTLDAFDFFIVTFVVTKIATDFHRSIPEIVLAITLTLAARPFGAIFFGALGDAVGRRLPLMIDIALFSLIEFATAFSPNYAVFLILRILFGVAMGGEWGLGAALTMESLPTKTRGILSGLLQEGYMVGYLLAAVANFVVFTWTPWGWRALFIIGVLPAILLFFIRRHVEESPTWSAASKRPDIVNSRGIATVKSLPLMFYAVLFMTAFNFMSHGTQDLYATFLQKQHGFSPSVVSFLAIVAAIGAILGGIAFGALSQRVGRRVGIIVAALLGVAAIPLWAYAGSIPALATGAFAMQFAVQGAWGIIPAHLNEISPPLLRGSFPGTVYQMGNLLSAGAAQIEATIAATSFALPGGGADYARALAAIATVVLVAVAALAAFGFLVTPERRDEALD
uniref:Major facilitator superfamily MFS_1 n=1 Tax=mine drainage metagenome TaxID=410659 RepID=E6PHP9_9ZZZZ